MGKKKPKPLLADHGIVHLKHSFVQPTEESGLLKTVGGVLDRSALILATGTYGYAIPISALTNTRADEENSPSSNHDVVEILEDISDPEVKVVKQVPASNSLTSKSGKRTKTLAKDVQTKKQNNVDVNPEELSIAELVRGIGGGRGAPLRKCDVVDDRVKETKDESQDDMGDGKDNEADPEADEFYESLGMQRSKKPRLDKDGPTTSTTAQSAADPANTDETDMLQSINDYYKNNVNHLYYYSQQNDPLGDHRLEIGPLIDVEDSSDFNQDYIQLARLAQRARAVAEKRKREMEKPENILDDEAIYDPLPMEVVATTKPEHLGITTDTSLEQYWEFVKEDPHDFDRWVYLIHYVENSQNLNACRGVYSAFLPLFPYCFGYWKRYSELEKKSLFFGRTLAILEKGQEFIPLSIDLWLSYIASFREINAHQPNFEDLVRKQYRRALHTCGMEFRSDPLWEAFAEWEIENKKIKKAFCIYRRLIQVPTRLYNRHWDNIQAMVRDHHPRDFLEYDEYEEMRKKGCKKLKFRYKPEPEVETGEIRKTSKPEDKLMDYTKSKILKQLTTLHSKCEEEVNKRWLFEDKIKRPYYHTKPLDKFQLRNWDEYLNFEIQEKNHDRIVLLFERCLIACAHYEEFWSKYARYVESYHKEHSKDMNVSFHVQKSKINEELVSQQETEREEAVITDVKEVLNNLMDNVVEAVDQENEVNYVVQSLIQQVMFIEENDNFVFNKFSTIAVNQYRQQLGSQTVNPKVGFADPVILNGLPEVNRRRPDLGGNCELPPKSGCLPDINVHSDCSATEASSLISVPTFPEARFQWQETVRDIYKRACIIHCAKKPVIRLQWAAFEEELGNLDESRKLVQHVLQWFPQFLDAKLQLLDLERRAGNSKVLEELYEKYLSTVKKPTESSLLSNKFARFLFKERGKPDKALTVLRKAIRKDKTNPSLYSYVFDICYERFPSDRKGAAAALEIAILSKNLSEENKLIFLRRKMLFYQEHGDIKSVRDVVDQLHLAEEKMRKVKADEQRTKDEEEKEIAFLRSQAIKQFQSVQLEAYPVPELTKAAESDPSQKPVPIEFDSNEVHSPSNPIRAKIIEAGASVSEVIKEGPELPYQKVAPPMDLMVDSSTYGYGSKHPDQKIMEHMAQKEYDKLEAKGYPENFKDTEEDKKYLRQQAKIKHSTKDSTYIVPPRESYSIVTIGGPPRRNLDPPAPGELELQPPRKMAILPVPSTAPCVNVPDWFLKEGGELCLGESRLGFSTLRYWPHFLTTEGNEKIFRNVRKHVKWHQKQKIIAGHWRYLHRLVSWLGPCDFTHNGMILQKCEDWPPEVLDQLHRINQMVNHEFNACSLDLYRHGHDWNSWHSDNLPAYGSNPPVAIVTLGALRILEMKRKGPEFNYVRFPLFPGSLFLMEGVTQADWAHQIIKDPLIKDETMALTFRIMHAIEVPESNKRIKFIKGSSDKQSSDNAKNEKTETSSSESPFKKLVEAIVSSDSGGKNNPPATTDELLETDKRNQTKIVFHKVR